MRAGSGRVPCLHALARVGSALVLGSALALLPSLSFGAEPPKTGGGIRIGVMAFEGDSPAGGEVKRVDTLIAEQLAMVGDLAVRGPEPGPVAAESYGPERLARWASERGVDWILAGSVTRLGRRSSIAVRLRSGATGERVATFVGEARDESELAAVATKLAAQVARRLGAARSLPPAEETAQEVRSDAPPGGPAAGGATAAARAGAAGPLAAPPEAPGAEAKPSPKQPALKAGGAVAASRSANVRGPITIEADELEATETDAGRRLLFRRHVRARQKDIALQADRLEAIYPPRAKEPERLVATGGVVVTQLGEQREMRCQQAVYYRHEQRILCRGQAELVQGNDRVAGREIEIFLGDGRVTVRGDARVRVEPRRAPQAGGGPP